MKGALKNREYVKTSETFYLRETDHSGTLVRLPMPVDSSGRSWRQERWTWQKERIQKFGTSTIAAVSCCKGSKSKGEKWPDGILTSIVYQYLKRAERAFVPYAIEPICMLAWVISSIQSCSVPSGVRQASGKGDISEGKEIWRRKDVSEILKRRLSLL